jgi:hypothetical protein
MVLWPTQDAELGRFVQRMTTTTFDAGIYIGKPSEPDISISVRTKPFSYKMMITS